jgi:hypothetical protein
VERSSSPTLGPSTTTKSILILVALGIAGCPEGGFGACADQPDITGHWTLSLTSSTPPTIASPATVEAHLEQQPQRGIGLGRLVYGTLTSMDKGLFDEVIIPRLVNNDGSKTGVVLGCSIKINVPIATPVTDDNLNQGPLRVSISGKIDAPQHLIGEGTSSVIPVAEETSLARSFAWTATLQQN